MKYFIVLTFLLSSFSSVSLYAKGKKSSEVNQMNAKWHHLNKLISEEERTIKSINRMGPRLKWRLLELGTERIKLIRERENKSFLSANSKARKARGKKSYFKESHKMYLKVRKDALRLIRKYPRFKYNSEIYYTLALNSRDYGGDKETEKYLIKSLRSAIPNSPIIHSAKTSLAEYYYNNKKYARAIRYYTDVLKNEDDEWYTKHLYNVSWCYLKTKKYNDAIENAKLSFFKSQDKRYISVKGQLLESIGFFFVLAERVEEGADFYVENVEKPGTYMIKMAKKTAEDRGYEKAHYVFNSALNNSISKKNLEEEVEIRLAQLDFFRNFKKFENFWKTTVALDDINKEKPLSEEFQTEAVEKVRSFVGYLQVRFTRNSKTNIESYNEEEKKRILNFFDVLARLNPIETDSYRFYQGETLFAISDFKGSFGYYQKALEHNKVKYSKKKVVGKDGKEKLVAIKVEKEDKDKHDALKKKIFDSLLASLENGRFSKGDRFNNTVYTYTNHLDLYPKNERSRVIYSKLFNLYLNAKQIDNAHPTLNRYVKTYPKDLKIQQGMFTEIMDHYILVKDTDSIALWIPKLQKGFLSFDRPYVEKAVLILGSLLFDGYQKMDSEGNKSEAAIGYLSLYESEKYPTSIKAKAAYRASLLYLDLYRTDDSLKWMNTALKLFTPKERFERKKEILAVVQNMMLVQDFSSSASIASQYIKIYCTSPFKEKEDLFRASVTYELIQGNSEKAYQNYKIGEKCGVNKAVTGEMLLGIGQFFLRHRQYKNYLGFYKRYKGISWLKKFYETSFISIYWDYYLSGSQKGMAGVRNIFTKEFIGKRKKKSNAVIEMDTIVNFDKVFPGLEKINVSNLGNPAEFKEEKFNVLLEKNIETLKGITAKCAPFIKAGYPHIVTRCYQLLETKYSELGHALIDFTPQNLPKDYVQGFKGAMKNLANNLLAEARGQKHTAIKLINKENILNPESSTLIGIPDVFSLIKHRHPASLYVLPKDRIGGPL